MASGAAGVLLDWQSWPDARALVAEIAEFAPVFVARRQPVAPAGNEYPFPAAFWQTDRQNRLIVVNNLPVARPLSWPSPGDKVRTLRRLPSGDLLRLSDGRFTDSFGPHEARIYESVVP